jgi:hypothetical protein
MTGSTERSFDEGQSVDLEGDPKDRSTQDGSNNPILEHWKTPPFHLP